MAGWCESAGPGGDRRIVLDWFRSHKGSEFLRASFYLHQPPASCPHGIAQRQSTTIPLSESSRKAGSSPEGQPGDEQPSEVRSACSAYPLSVIMDQAVAQRILQSLDLPFEPPVVARARAPTLFEEAPPPDWDEA